MCDSYYLGKHQKGMVKFKLKTLLVRLKIYIKLLKLDFKSDENWSLWGKCLVYDASPHPLPKHLPLPFPTSPTQPNHHHFRIWKYITLRHLLKLSDTDCFTLLCGAVWMGCKEPWQNIDIWWAWPENGLNPWHVACSSIYRWKLNIRIGAVLPWRFSQLSTLNCHLGYLWCTNAKLCKHAIFF